MYCDLFQLPISKEVFASTNATWNKLRLNAPWSVGYVSYLIQQEHFSCKESWVTYYYQSGKDRDAAIKLLPADIQDLLNSHCMATNKKKQFYALPQAYQDLNFKYGRSQHVMHQKAVLLHQAMQQQASHISLQECVVCVRYRTVAESWNGIVVREQNTLKTLQNVLPQLSFKHTTGKYDHTYAIDYEVFKKSKKVAALQIKPASYKYNTPYLLSAKKANKLKFMAYQQIYKVPVYVVLAKYNGTIVNQEVLHNLQAIS